MFVKGLRFDKLIVDKGLMFGKGLMFVAKG